MTVIRSPFCLVAAVRSCSTPRASTPRGAWSRS